MSRDHRAESARNLSEHRPGWGRLLPVLLPAALLVTASPIFPAELTQALSERDAIRGITVWDSQVLEPEADTEVEFDEARLELLSDGSTRVLISGTLTPGETKNFAYFVDREAGSYSTVELPASYIDAILERSRNEGDSESTSESPMYGGPNLGVPQLELPGNNIEPPGGYSSCDYEVRGLLTHYDPVLIPLAATTSTLRWRHDHGSNCLNRLWANRTCWWAAVTPLGTHWFNQICSSLDRNISLRHLQKTTHAYYYNWDFGDPAERTWVDHFIQIDARTGVSTFFMADNDGGEYSLLIFSIGSIGMTDLGCRP